MLRFSMPSVLHKQMLSETAVCLWYSSYSIFENETAETLTTLRVSCLFAVSDEIWGQSLNQQMKSYIELAVNRTSVRGRSPLPHWVPPLPGKTISLPTWLQVSLHPTPHILHSSSQTNQCQQTSIYRIRIVLNLYTSVPTWLPATHLLQVGLHTRPI